MILKKSIIPLLLLCLPLLASSSPAMQDFPLSYVRLLDSPFKTAQDRDMDYMKALDPDRLLAPYLREAGLKPKAESYGNWENTGLDGHIGGHYLSALSMMYAATGDGEIGRRLLYVVSELKRCQDSLGTGYIGGVPGGAAMWAEIAAGKINASAFGLNGKWVPLYNIHKAYAGLRDAWIYTGNVMARDMLIGMSDWMILITANLTDNQIEDMLRSEHGGLNEIFADVYDITGEKKYLDLARRFSHRAILTPLLSNEDKLTGLHANTQIPKVIGYKRIADLDNDAAWDNAAGFFWSTVVDNRSVSIGGNSVREHFHPADNFTPMVTDREGPETCNTYNMLRLSKMFFEGTGDDKYLDFYERGLYNHILSTEHPEKGGFVYFTSIRPGHYRVYSQPETSFWCCVGSGLENHAKYGEMIYTHSGDSLFVNLFIPSVLDWKERNLTLSQRNTFPDSNTTTITIDKLKKPGKFTVLIRCPQWAKDPVVEVNGKASMRMIPKKDNYICLTRKWKAGDVITVKLDPTLALERLPDGSPYYSVRYGPIVLAAATDTTAMPGLFADASRMAHVASGKYLPLDRMPMLTGTTESVLGGIKRTDSDKLSFTTRAAVYPGYSDITLVPFFRIHESRYAVYFRLASDNELEGLRKKIAEEEAESLDIDSRTIDVVYAGEQQPENDHSFRSENSNTGTNADRRWRSTGANGWFSYDMKTGGEGAKTISITLYGSDRAGKFAVAAGAQKTYEVSSAENKGELFYTVELPLPTAMHDTQTVKLSPLGGVRMPNIYEVRILKSK